MEFLLIVYVSSIANLFLVGVWHQSLPDSYLDSISERHMNGSHSCCNEDVCSVRISFEILNLLRFMRFHTILYLHKRSNVHAVSILSLSHVSA